MKERVEKEAIDLIAKRAQWLGIDGMPTTKLIAVSKGFMPAMAMIDKSVAELNALKDCFEGIYVRLCEFHVIQALRRMSGDDDEIGRLSMRGFSESTESMIDGFRNIARARDSRDVKKRIQHFLDVVIPNSIDLARKKSKADKQAMIAKARQYFEKNWFCLRWIDSWIDCGYPSGFNRETANTNNPVEAAFKVFDVVLLGCVKNRRIDHLILVIITHLFPYYEQVKGN